MEDYKMENIIRQLMMLVEDLHEEIAEQRDITEELLDRIEALEGKKVTLDLELARTKLEEMKLWNNRNNPQ